MYAVWPPRCRDAHAGRDYAEIMRDCPIFRPDLFQQQHFIMLFVVGCLAHVRLAHAALGSKFAAVTCISQLAPGETEIQVTRVE